MHHVSDIQFLDQQVTKAWKPNWAKTFQDSAYVMNTNIPSCMTKLTSMDQVHIIGGEDKGLNISENDLIYHTSWY